MPVDLLRHLRGSPVGRAGSWPGLGGTRRDVSRQFSGPYPFLRVFGASEWEIALGLVSGRSLDAAAFWGAKEAAVKALGVGFHMQDPSEITVSNARSRDEGTL